MSKRLFEEFSPVSKKAWQEKLVKDLKGRPYEKLIRLSAAGIAVAPLYAAEDLPPDSSATFPGDDDFRRGSSPLVHAAEPWQICQAAYFESVSEIMRYLEAQGDNLKALNIHFDSAIQNASSLSAVNSARAHDGLWVENWRDLLPIANWAKQSGQKILLACGKAGLDLLKSENAEIAALLPPSLNFQAFDWSDASNQSLVAAFLQKGNTQSAKLFAIDLGELELNAANGIQQIAFALGMAVELVSSLENAGLTAREVFSQISFRFPIGTEFLTEIAKIRALRSLWANVLEAYGIAVNEDFFQIHAFPAKSSETIADPQVNILRQTTAAMSAIFAGCNMIELPAYDHLYDGPNNLSLRIARNIHLVLREESDLGKVIDPVGGAYFVEHATDALAEEAWLEFQKIEGEGGWRKALQAGRIDKELTAQLEKRTSAIKTAQKVLLGTNMYPKAGEKLPTVKHTQSNDSRSGAPFEELRYRMQAHEAATGKSAKVMLFSYGNPAMRAARVNFSSNLFAAAGFECLENPNDQTLDHSIKAAIAEMPQIVVLCAADADYIEKAPEIFAALRKGLPDSQLILAGKPPEWESFLSAGLNAPIFAGMDRYEFLRNTMNALNIGKEAQNEA